jgi:hypothetical protein
MANPSKKTNALLTPLVQVIIQYIQVLSQRLSPVHLPLSQVFHIHAEDLGKFHLHQSPAQARLSYPLAQGLLWQSFKAAKISD